LNSTIEIRPNSSSLSFFISKNRIYWWDLR
jgi:hypothetical protein